nr:MAG TPA: hypothetical protein [Caudoviricetes sp.]
MRSTRSKPLKRPTETSSYIPTWDIGFFLRREHGIRTMARYLRPAHANLARAS